MLPSFYPNESSIFSFVQYLASAENLDELTFARSSALVKTVLRLTEDRVEESYPLFSPLLISYFTPLSRSA